MRYIAPLRQPRFDRGIGPLPVSPNAWSAEAIRRKLRALGAVLLDPAATENERANAQALKLRLQKQLGQAGAAPDEGVFAGMLFRLGRGVRQVKELKQTTAPPAPKGDWTDNAFRLGKLFRKGLKK
jgi:hypothetical protein